MNDQTNAWITAAAAGLINCHSCGLLHKVAEAHVCCHRCGTSLHLRKPDSLPRTWAYLLAAYVLYIPANVLPIMTTTNLGSIQSNTILSGVNYLLVTGSWLLALIIFIASVFVPALKLVILTYLAISVQVRSSWRPRERAWLYRLAEIMGRWSMVDIYVVTLMVALVKIQGLADIDAGSGAVAFGAVVVLTMLAAMSFDPRLIWDNAEKNNE
nr:paraquat-inducible protein A [Nitrosomonas sp.]